MQVLRHLDVLGALTRLQHHIEETRLDAKQAIRAFRRNRPFFLSIIFTFGLGIGANCLVFSVINAVLLRPFPFRQPERLVFLSCETDRVSGIPCSLPDLSDWRARNKVFESIAAWRIAVFDWRKGSYPDRIVGQRVTANLLPALGIYPQLGRAFMAEDERNGADTVVMISDRFWRSRFNADPHVVGLSLQVSRDIAQYERFTIVGVLPRSVETVFPRTSDIWTPLALDGPEAKERRMRALNVVARVKSKMTLSQAEAHMRLLSSELASAYPQTNKGISVHVKDFTAALTGEARGVLPSLMAAVGFVMIIACANIMNLMLARAVDRESELKVRAALGASRRRLFRQLLAEVLLLSAAGGVVGIILAYFSIGVTRSLIPASILRAEMVGVDTGSLLFAAGLSGLAGLLAGTLPALSASRVRLLRPTHVGVSSRGAVLRHAVIATEIALSVILLTGAGLTIKGFVRLLAVDPGFNQQNLLIVQTFLPPQQYRNESHRSATVEQILERIRTVPGVNCVGVTDSRPLGKNLTGVFRRDSDQSLVRQALIETIGGDYFRALGIRSLGGRPFDARDDYAGAPVVVVNETAARQYWPNDTAIGKYIVMDGNQSGKARQVVGIVSDVRHRALYSAPEPMLYLPQSQVPSYFVELIVQTRGGVSASSVAPSVREAMASVNTSIAAQQISTMQAIVAEHLARHRFVTMLLGAFALIAVVLTAIGIYGVVAHTIQNRNHEIAVRLCLGSSRRSIFALFLGRTVRLAFIGFTVGGFGAVFAARILASILYGLEPLNLAVSSTVVLFLAAVSLLASYVPIRRATSVDPLATLRYE